MKIQGPLSEIEFYADSNDPTVTYAEVVVPAIGVCEKPYKLFMSIDDEKLQSYIRQVVIPRVKGNLSSSALLQKAKDFLALSGNPDTIAPRVRTAGKLREGVIEYDLNNPSHEYVRITETGWKIVRNTKHKFLKRNTLGVQVVPQRTSKKLLALLKPYINVDRDGLILFTAWLVQAFCMGHHNALLVTAPAGSGKTYASKTTKRILDPGPLSTNVMPDKKDDLFAVLTNSYFVALDNTEVLSRDFSNALCTAVTGATMAKRKLYTTNELGVFELHNTLLLNGLEIMPNQYDLASRCLLLKLKELDEKSRKTDEELEEKFSNDLPEILGAIFDILSQAMTIIQNLQPKKLPRMGTAYIEMLAVAIAFGVEEAEFERIYFDDLAALDKERASISVVEAVCEFMTSKYAPGRFVEGKVQDIYEKIRSNYSGSVNDLPKTASHFSRKVKQELKTFEAAGLTINLDNTFSDGTHIKIIKNK